MQVIRCGLVTMAKGVNFMSIYEHMSSRCLSSFIQYMLQTWCSKSWPRHLSAQGGE